MGGNTLLMRAVREWPDWLTGTTLYSCGKQRSISGCTASQTLSWMDNNRRSDQTRGPYSKVEQNPTPCLVSGFRIGPAGLVAILLAAAALMDCYCYAMETL